MIDQIALESQIPLCYCFFLCLLINFVCIKVLVGTTYTTL